MVDSRQNVTLDGVMYIVSNGLWWIPGQMRGSICPTSCGGFQARCDIQRGNVYCIQRAVVDSRSDVG